MFHAMFHAMFLGVMFCFVLKEVSTFSSFIDWGVGGSSVFTIRCLCLVQNLMRFQCILLSLPVLFAVCILCCFFSLWWFWILNIVDVVYGSFVFCFPTK